VPGNCRDHRDCHDLVVSLIFGRKAHLTRVAEASAWVAQMSEFVLPFSRALPPKRTEHRQSLSSSFR